MLRETADASSEPSQRNLVQDSPTAAVKSAIEAQIAETPDSVSFETMFSVTDFDKDNVVPSIPPLAPFTAPLPANNPNLFSPRAFPPFRPQQGSPSLRKT